MNAADELSIANEPRAARRAVLVFLLAFAAATAIVLAIFAGALPGVAGVGAVAVVLTVVFWLLRANLPSILLVFVSVLLLSVLITQRAPKLRAGRDDAGEVDRLSRKWAESGRFNDNLPVVFHLVFDEMMSTGAMTGDLPRGAELRQSMLELGEKYSFRTYDSVYSRYFFSGESLPNMINPEYGGKVALSEIFTRQQGAPKKNAYFSELAGRGYRTAVFQSALMNFCASPDVDLCETFDSFDPGEGGAAGLDPRNQRASLWQTMLRAYEPSYTSQLGQTVLRRAYGLTTQDVGVMGISDRYDVQRFPAWFDRFTQFAVSVPRGSHVFAHFMVPHSPYLLSETCVVSGTFEGGYYLGNYPAMERDAKRRRFYQGYFAQLGCVQRKLDDFMAALADSEKFRDAVIVIHGDHGSRISIGNVLEDYKQRDFIDNYGTFFAVRSPAAAPGVDCEFVSLPEIFRRHMSGGGRVGSRTAPPLPVIVTSRAAGNAKVEAAMPKFGCAAVTSPGTS